MNILLHDKISPLIESQFPAFYREEGPQFVAFVKAYYEWLEQTGNPLHEARNLLQYRDIDSTLDAFIPHFADKYLNGARNVTIGEQRDLIKHSHDLYQTKGTVQSLRLVFRMLFGESVDVYYPGDDILRASDGVWVIPKYIELSVSDMAVTFVGRDIRGNLSGAKAFVERVDRKTFDGKVVDVAYLSNVQPNQETGQAFVYGEYISADGIIKGAPQVVGSLTRVNITSSGSGFVEGETVDIVSSRRGHRGKARVTSVGNRTGEVNYRLLDGGYGYTLNANIYGTDQKVYVSANVLSLTAFTSSNSFITSFPEFTTVVQPLTNVSFSTANTTFSAGDLVYGTTNTTSQVLATGFVLSVSQAVGSGTMVISPHTTAAANIDSVQFANTMTGSFIIGESVYQSNSSGNAAVGTVVKANSSYIVLDQRYGPFANGQLIIGSTSGARANAASVDIRAFDNTNFSNTNITRLLVGETTGGAYKTGASDISASANVVGSNTGAVGVFEVTNSFKGGSHAWLYSPYNGAVADITVTSSGYPGQFKIGAIGNTEVVYLGSDLLSANAAPNTTFLELPLDSSTYGFAANTSANLSSVLASAFSKNAYTIGTVLTLTERNPGYDNTAKPFVVEIEQIVASYGKRSRFTVGIANNVGMFGVGERVTQSINLPVANVAVTNASGTFDFSIRETIKQVRADGHTTFGDLYTTSLVSGAGSIRILIANTANTFDSSNTIVGLVSGTTANVTSVGLANVGITTSGIVVGLSNNQVDIQRTSFRDFVRGSIISGAESGATANVVTIQEDSSSGVLGNNVYVDPEAGISDGRINTLEVLDSGFLYEDGETVDISAPGNQITAAGIARIETYGSSEGYWRGDRGTLDSTKRIQDNEYYQEYSYEIRTGLSREKYESVVKSLTHVVGTKMFNKYVGVTLSSKPVASAKATYSRITTLTLSGTTGTYVVGETVSQASQGTGRVISYNNTLNRLQLVDVVGSFTASGTVTGASATATINSVNLLFI
jgi:hypothetical protein